MILHVISIIAWVHCILRGKSLLILSLVCHPLCLILRILIKNLRWDTLLNYRWVLRRIAHWQTVIWIITRWKLWRWKIWIDSLWINDIFILYNSSCMNDFNFLAIIIDFPTTFTTDANYYRYNYAGKNSSNCSTYNHPDICTCIISIVNRIYIYFIVSIIVIIKYQHISSVGSIIN